MRQFHAECVSFVVGVDKDYKCLECCVSAAIWGLSPREARAPALCICRVGPQPFACAVLLTMCAVSLFAVCVARQCREVARDQIDLAVEAIQDLRESGPAAGAVSDAAAAGTTTAAAASPPAALMGTVCAKRDA